MNNEPSTDLKAFKDILRLALRQGTDLIEIKTNTKPLFRGNKKSEEEGLSEISEKRWVIEVQDFLLPKDIEELNLGKTIRGQLHIQGVTTVYLVAGGRHSLPFLYLVFPRSKSEEDMNEAAEKALALKKSQDESEKKIASVPKNPEETKAWNPFDEPMENADIDPFGDPTLSNMAMSIPLTKIEPMPVIPVMPAPPLEPVIPAPIVTRVENQNSVIEPLGGDSFKKVAHENRAVNPLFDVKGPRPGLNLVLGVSTQSLRLAVELLVQKWSESVEGDVFLMDGIGLHLRTVACTRWHSEDPSRMFGGVLGAMRQEAKMIVCTYPAEPKAMRLLFEIATGPTYVALGLLGPSIALAWEGFLSHLGTEERGWFEKMFLEFTKDVYYLGGENHLEFSDYKENTLSRISGRKAR